MLEKLTAINSETGKTIGVYYMQAREAEEAILRDCLICGCIYNIAHYPAHLVTLPHL